MHIRPSCISSEITSSTRGGNASQIRTSAGKHGANSSARLQLGITEIIKRHTGQQNSTEWSKMQKWQMTIFCHFSVPCRGAVSKKSTVAIENHGRREGFIQPSHSEQNRYVALHQFEGCQRLRFLYIWLYWTYKEQNSFNLEETCILHTMFLRYEFSHAPLDYP
jgi:hypothetical protein